MALQDVDPEDLARNVVLSVADKASQVGDLISGKELGDGVFEYRFTSHITGYEGWQWSVTLYHDLEGEQWTVDESSLVPGEGALMPPAWIPWKDRLLPSDFSVTDAMGTEPGDPRLEDGFGHRTDRGQATRTADGIVNPGLPSDAGDEGAETDQGGGADGQAGGAVFTDKDADRTEDGETPAEGAEVGQSAEDGQTPETSDEDLEEAVETFRLSRRHVLSAEGRAEAAKRWYEGQHGPRSLSTRTADGHTCDTCGFMIPLQGELGTMFGVCANRWSPDDGRVVSLDHGCGEHSEIEPPEEPSLWVQSKPAYDDLHIDVVKQKPREESPEVELIEELAGGEDETGAKTAQEDSSDEEGETMTVRTRSRRRSSHTGR